MTRTSKRSPRAGARRSVKRQLDELKRNVEKLRRWWDASSTIYVSPSERQEGDPYSRPRPLEEYPEAQRLYWHATVNEIDDMMRALAKLRAECVAEYHKTPENPAPLSGAIVEG